MFVVLVMGQHFDCVTNTLCCLGGAVVERRTRDRKVAGSTPGRGAIKSTIGQLSLPSFRSR